MLSSIWQQRDNEEGRKRMIDTELSTEEIERRIEIAEKTRDVIKSSISVADEDEISVMSDFRGYYLQVSISRMHPLLVICLARPIQTPITDDKYSLVNEMNLRSILGCHTINEDIGCYTYRATQWLDIALNQRRFFEILDRCCGEAAAGYAEIFKE